MGSLLDIGVFGFGGRRHGVFNLDTGSPIVPVPGIQRTLTPQSVTEGTTATLSVRLRTQPSANVNIIPGTDDSSALTIAPAVQIFTTANWATPKNFTLTAPQDSDADDESVTISLLAASSDTDYNNLTSSFVVNVIDNDVVGITRTATPSAITEGGTNQTVSFRLNTQPTGTVIVTGTTGDSSALAFTGGSFRSFTTSNWDTAQSLTLTAPQDDDSTSETVLVTLTATGNDYAGITSSFNLTVTDDDTPAFVLVNAANLTEGGSATSGSIKLATLPSGTVTVTIVSGDTGAVTVSPASMTFPAAFWNTAQAFTLTPIDDTDATNESVTITFTGSGGGYGSVAGTQTVTVTDDDSVTPKTLVLVGVPSTLSEDALQTAFTIKLSEQPTGNVLVSVASSDTGALTVTPASRSFTMSNWDDTKAMAVTPVSDSDATDESVSLVFTVTGGGFAEATETRTITITDTDTATPTMWLVGRANSHLLELDFSGTAVSGTQIGSATHFGLSTETGGGDSNDAGEFPNGLTHEDGVLYMVDNATDALYTLDTTTGLATIVGTGFTSVNAPIGLTFLDDVMYMVNNAGDTLWTVDPSTGVATFVGTYGTPSSGRSLGTNGVNLYIVDAGNNSGTLYRLDKDDGTSTQIATAQANLNNLQGLTLHQGTMYGVRSGSGNATARLVTINLTTAVTSTVLTVSNFNTDATIAEGNPSGIASNSPGVSGASGQTMGFVPTNIPSSVTEGSTATFNVKLNASPSEGSTTAVTVTSKHVNGVAVTGGASLTFDTSDWDTAQDVTITGVGGGGGIVSQIVLEASGGGFDDNIMDMFVKNVAIDDSLIVGAHSLAKGEGSTGNFKVRLSSQPTGDVTVTTVSANSNKVYITAGATLTFTTSNWNTNRGVDIYFYADTDSDDEFVDLTLTASGGGNSATAVRTIRVIDDD